MSHRKKRELLKRRTFLSLDQYNGNIKNVCFTIKTSQKSVKIGSIMKLLWSLLRRHVVSNLTLSRQRPLPYRNQSIDLLNKSIDWFLYDNGLRHERVNSGILIRIYFSKNFMVLFFKQKWKTLCQIQSLKVCASFYEKVNSKVQKQPPEMFCKNRCH